MEKLFTELSPEEKQEFWKGLESALKWRGWDDKGKHESVTGCHACDFINFVEELAEKHGHEFETYT